MRSIEMGTRNLNIYVFVGYSCRFSFFLRNSFVITLLICRTSYKSIHHTITVSTMGTRITSKQVITSLSGIRPSTERTSKSTTTDQFNYTEMDSMTTQDVGTRVAGEGKTPF